MMTSCSRFTFSPYTRRDGRIAVEKVEFDEKGYVVLDVNDYPKPVYVHRHDDNDFSAIVLECTHQNGTVRPQDDGKLKCNRHGSEFSNKGDVVEGPADESLKRLRVDMDDTYVYVYE